MSGQPEVQQNPFLLGLEALEAITQQSFDLVLMPGMDGIQATVAIREKEKGTLDGALERLIRLKLLQPHSIQCP